LKYSKSYFSDDSTGHGILGYPPFLFRISASGHRTTKVADGLRTGATGDNSRLFFRKKFRMNIKLLHRLRYFVGEALSIGSADELPCPAIRTVPARQGGDCNCFALVHHALTPCISRYVPAPARATLFCFHFNIGQIVRRGTFVHASKMTFSDNTVKGADGNREFSEHSFRSNNGDRFQRRH